MENWKYEMGFHVEDVAWLYGIEDATLRKGLSPVFCIWKRPDGTWGHLGREFATQFNKEKMRFERMAEIPERRREFDKILARGA